LLARIKSWMQHNLTLKKLLIILLSISTTIPIIVAMVMLIIITVNNSKISLIHFLDTLQTITNTIKYPLNSNLILAIISTAMLPIILHSRLIILTIHLMTQQLTINIPITLTLPVFLILANLTTQVNRATKYLKKSTSLLLNTSTTTTTYSLKTTVIPTSSIYLT